MPPLPNTHSPAHPHTRTLAHSRTRTHPTPSLEHTYTLSSLRYGAWELAIGGPWRSSIVHHSLGSNAILPLSPSNARGGDSGEGAAADTSPSTHAVRAGAGALPTLALPGAEGGAMGSAHDDVYEAFTECSPSDGRAKRAGYVYCVMFIVHDAGAWEMWMCMRM